MDTEAISLDLERAALHEIAREWRGANYQLFHEMMSSPTFVLTDSQQYLGRWVPYERSIELSRELLLNHQWIAVIETLKHEMVHQYVDEVLGVRDQSAHGPVFQRVCAEKHIDPRAVGVPNPSLEHQENSGDSARAAVLSKVAKLLALAQSTNEHEAQSAMNAAQRLMLKHNLDELEARQERGYVSRELGVPMGRLEESIGAIGGVLRDHFFVEVIQLRVWRVRDGARGTVLEVTGTPSNVSLAEYVYSFLHHTAELLWSQHKKTRGIKGDRDRRAYRAGVVSGFSDKLRKEQQSNVERGLVWVGDPALNSHYRKRYPRIVLVSSSGAGSYQARSDGQEAGRKLVLHKGVEEGESSHRGLRLGDGKS